MVEAWIICFWLALALLIATVIFAGVKRQMKYKSGRLLDPSKILFGGVLLTTLVLFMPVHLADFATQDAGWLKSILLSFYST